MSYGTPHRLRPGGDPCALPDYTQLRDELSKLTHPARPDVDWQQVESLSLSLFSHNGVELQTAAWYTLARTQLAGLHGLCEGLAVLEVLLAHQWGSLWPQPVHARMEILTSLSQRLQQVMRTLAFSYSDLGKLYQAEQHLSGMGAVLQRLELKHISQLDILRGQMHNAAIRLEKSSRAGQIRAHEGIALPDAVTKNTPARATPATTQFIFVAQPEPTENITVVKTPSPPLRPWKAFVAGAFVMLAAGSAALWGWQVFNHPDPQTAQLEASLMPLPDVLSEQQLMELKQKNDMPVDLIPRTQQQLTRLAQQSPVWALQYGNQLVRQAQVLEPAQSQTLVRQWQQQLNAAALPPESLTGWSQGMTQLQLLADRLNELDEQRGKYITVSELKSQVFGMLTSFRQTVPAEEQLRQIKSELRDSPVRQQQIPQVEQHLRTLLYTLNAIAGNERGGNLEGKH